MTKSLSQQIKESGRVNESLLLTMGFVALCTYPFFNSEFAKSVGNGIGGMFGGIGSLFRKIGEAKVEREKAKAEREKEKLQAQIEKEKNKKEIEKLQAELDKLKSSNVESNEQVANMVGVMINAAKEGAPDDVKDFLDTVSGCIRNAGGSAVDPAEWPARLKKATGKTPAELMKDYDIKELTPEKQKELQEELKTKLEEKTPSELEQEVEKAAEDATESAKKLQAKIEQAEKDAETAADNDDEETFDKKMKEVEKLKDAQKKQREKQSEEKDEHGNTIKDEEVTDKKTGKKIKVKMHIGPRGGKFYYPEGSPKDMEHRVYVECSLMEWLETHLG